LNLSTANLTRWAKLLSTYFAGQGAMQVMQLLTGFILIRCLSKDGYAIYTIVIAIQCTTGVLVELGISSSLTALIGKRYANTEVMGRYFTACRFFRDRLLLIGGGVLLVVFYLISPKYGWGYGYWFILWLSVIAALIFQAWGAIYGPVFTLHNRLREMYVISVSAAAWRLVMIVGIYLTGWLTAATALIFGALQMCITGWGAREFAKPFMQVPPPDADLSVEKKDILSQALPRAPSNVFYAFEGQITVFILGVLGATSSVAELGAISRLGMLFILFRRAGGVVIGPYFSKLDTPYVRSRAMFCIAASVGLCLVSSGFTYFLPQVPLFLLGPSYQHLDFEVFLLIFSSSLSIVTITIFSICVARKYIFPWFSIVDLGPTCLVMVAGFFIWDLSQLVNVLYYSIAMASVKLLSMLFILFLGIKRETAEMSPSS
jgi:O-antigen/teichoic acid export membrane protein